MTGGRVLRWSSLILAMLLPYAANLAWEHVETKRLASRVAEIRSKGEPISSEQARPPEGPAATRFGAYRFYQAAASLTHVDRDEALRMLDRATALPYEGFPAGERPSSYAVGNLFILSNAVGQRTLESARRGDANGAMASLYAEARLNRLLQDSAPQGMGYPWRLAAHLVETVERTRPDAPHLSRLADALVDLDADAGLRRYFVAHRAGLLEGLARGGGWRPLDLHRRSTLIDVDTELIAAADRPWPARLDAIGALAERRARAWRLMHDPADLMNIAATLVEAEALNLAVVRSARSVIAVERYRRDHGEQTPAGLGDLVPEYLATLPVDPFSGEALKFLRRGDDDLAYSVGSDRHDAGGQLPAEWPRNNQEAAAARDLGLRVRNRSRPSTIDH